MATCSDWTIPGAEGELIYGTSHLPGTDPLGVVVIAHGFKGYKDYGMFPRIARTCADAGFIAHRFNFSHSGMTANTEIFERPDLFERDTWNKQVFDCRCVIDAIAGGTLVGASSPLVLFGHSRGGVSVLLTAGRYAEDHALMRPVGVITAATPSSCNSLSEPEQQQLLRDGFLDAPSARTGQALRVGKAYLAEQLDEPEAHDLLGQAKRVRCAALIIHGDSDPTVPVSCAGELGKALGERSNTLIIPGADHVFNTMNPLPSDAEPSEQLSAMLDAMTKFAASVCEMASS